MKKYLVLVSAALLVTGCATQQSPAEKPLQTKDSYASLISGSSGSAGSQQSFAVNKNVNLQSFGQVQQAAFDGDPDAEYALGYMYFYGKDGAPHDVTLGHQWIARAAAQGQTQALQAIEMLQQTKHPDAGQVTMAQNAAPTKTATTTKVTTKLISATPKTTKPVVTAAKKKHHEQTHVAKAPKTNSTDHYTLQLASGDSKDGILWFMHRYKLQSKASFYKTTRDGKAWYVLTYGAYKTDQDAEKAIRTLPMAVQKHKPWVKPLAEVRTEMKEG